MRGTSDTQRRPSFGSPGQPASEQPRGRVDRVAEIAHAFGLTVETVKSYLRSAMRKLGVRNRTRAVLAARAAGLL